MPMAKRIKGVIHLRQLLVMDINMPMVRRPQPLVTDMAIKTAHPRRHRDHKSHARSILIQVIAEV